MSDPQADAPAVKATLDELFRRALARHPDRVALVDPADRTDFTDGPVRRLTYAQGDRAISALAARLRAFGLPTDAVVAIQLPNICESVIALLAVARAGLIAAPMPLLWRHADATAALSRVAARALIGCQRVGDAVHGDIAMQIAMETFTIRFLCGFGDNLPDGVVPVDDIFATRDAAPLIDRAGHAADHLALVTFDVTADGIVPIARSHAELLAAGLAVQLEGGIAPDAVFLGALAPASFASLATTIMPWLISGGTLVLHQPFAPDVFARQHAQERCSVAVVPGPMVMRLAEAGLIGDGGTAVLAVWRAPERLAASASSSALWPADAGTLTDVAVFGELGLVPLRRSEGGKPSALPTGRIAFPRGAAQGMHAVNLSRTPGGTVALSGPMVPKAPFPPGAERGHAVKLKITDGAIDTGYSCKIDRDTRMLTVDGPPAGVISVGGYRFGLRAAQELVGGIEDGSTLAALPDTLAGHRLAGSAANRDAICEVLLAHGANPLLVAAFRARRGGRQNFAA
jgi:AMP-binding enzyme